MVENRFPELPWHQVAESISRAIFAIETPEGTGSGFLISIVRPKKGAHAETHGAVIGTAWHVIADLYGAGRRSDFKIIRWSDKIDVVPLVSAYIPNRLRHDLVLPGLSSIIPISIIRGMLEKELDVTCLDPGVWSGGSEA